MTNINNAITSLHVQKLGHKIEEIRSRALESIISKLEHGFTFNCEGIKGELLSKLFNWFTYETIPHPGKVLDLIHYLIARNLVNINNFEESRFVNELCRLRYRLDPVWQSKIDEIEEAARHVQQIIPDEFQTYRKSPISSDTGSDKWHKLENTSESSQETVPIDTTIASEPGTPVSKRTENAIRWLVMPWQPLVSSDKGVLAAVEEGLNNQNDTDLIIHTCQLITNVMLQDFPAEVFLQRPSIVTIFQTFLKTSQEPKIIATVLKALHKLSRSIRFRIYYYCDPSIANKKQKLLEGHLDHSCPPSEHSSNDDQSLNNVDESVLQLQQMVIPNYCTDSLTNVLKLFSISVETSRPLKDIKVMMDLASELVELLNLSLMPSIWLCSDGISLKIHEDLKTLMKLLGDILEFLRSYSTVDHWRITYLQLICITMKLLSSLVPLEVSDYVLPRALKISIAVALMDAPIYLIYPGLNATLQEYIRQFSGPDEAECLKLFDETRIVTKSMKSAISILKSSRNQEIVKTMYNSKSCLNYHKNYIIIKKYISELKNYNDYNPEDKVLALRLILYLLANGDDEIRLTTYKECQWLVSAALGVEKTRGRFNWMAIAFLLDSNVLLEITCHGLFDGEEIKTLAEDILIFILKGKLQMGEIGWSKFLESLIPIFPLLQCLADNKSPLGQCISKMLDPDIYSDINLTYIEVLKGNIRFLFSSESSIREEAVFRLIYLLGMAKDANDKHPRLASLHGLPLSSLLVLERQCTFKRTESTYERSNLCSVLEILKMQNVEPKVRKSALVQISVMLTDTSLHKLFIKEKGLDVILQVFNRALIEDDFENYPDSVIPILSILKMLSSTQAAVRHDLSNCVDVFVNVMRSLFLFPNHESVKLDASQLLFILLFNDQMTCTEVHQNISLPEIVLQKMKVPFICKSHWKSSINRKPDTSLLHSSNPIALTFVRQFWSWEWNNGEGVLWLPWENANDKNLSEKLMIREAELASIKYTSIRFYTQQQLFNIKNSTSHEEVTCALDYLWMYVKLSELNSFEKCLIDFTSMPWKHSFERFLLSHPTNKQDCDLFVNVLNFLNILITVTKNYKVINWLAKTMRNMTKSLSDLLRSLDKNYQNIHQSVLKLVRTCTNLEKIEESEESDENMNDFIEIIVSNLCSNDQQHFYNLVYLDWLLTCLTYLTSVKKWKKIQSNRNLVETLGNSLMELIVSFHRNGAVSFMGLSITKNSIICLNHLLEHMETKVSFWYENGRTINWLPTLWTNRDPLVRASALQLLAGLIRAPHVAQQLLYGLAIAPNELCQTLIRFIINREESCLVREEAAIALSNLIKNANNPTYQYCDSLRPNAILIYIEQANFYYEISLLCSNIYLLPTLDPSVDEEFNSNSSEITGKSSTSLIKSVLHYYNCHDELLMLSVKDSMNDIPQFVTTPSLITAVCNLLNNLIVIGEREVVNKIYENSVDKYFISCFGTIPKNQIPETRSIITQYSDILQMYANICTVLTNCISHCSEFASAVNFSPDFLYLLLNYLKKDDYKEEKFICLRNNLWTEVFNLISVLSLTETQHIEAMRTAIELSGPEVIITAICNGINSTNYELCMSAVACLAFLLTQEMQRDTEIKYGCNSLGAVLDSTLVMNMGPLDDKLQNILSNVNRLTLNKTSNGNESVGTRICSTLVHLMIAHNYTNAKKNNKTSRDKDIIVGALSNLLCVSNEAKRNAINDNLIQTSLSILKELYTELNLQPYLPQKNINSEREKKLNPIFNDINRILILLMNFSYDSKEVKCQLANAGMADILHKLWAWISLNDSALISALKLMATVTSNCLRASQSLILTTTLPGSGPRKTPNTLSLLNVIIKLITREIEKAGRAFNSHRLHFAFHVLRNSVHVHECRVTISKSNLLQFFTKIHPATTKRNKPWPLIEIYCLEFLIDFTFYEEGQVTVPKSTDGFEVLIQLAKCNSSSTRILALSTLRNLVFNVANRPRIFSSIEFMNLLNFTLKNSNFSEIGIVASILWSLVANNQKAKLIARTAGFAHSLQGVLGRLSLDKIPDENQQKELARMIQYVIKLIEASDSKSDVND